jgi:ribosomal subunit interface protein
MEINIIGRNLGVTDRFREYATEKSGKIAHLADRALALEIKVSRHHEKQFGAVGEDRVELTLIGPGPLVRAESRGEDKYVAFDLALARLLERVRRAKDKRKVHRGLHRTPSLGEVSADGFRGMDIAPADAELIDQVETGSVSVVGVGQSGDNEEYNPVVIRSKVFPAEWLTVDDAVGRMELIGHDFFLFMNAESRHPSVVYRRQGWDYGVISLEAAEEVAR